MFQRKKGGDLPTTYSPTNSGGGGGGSGFGLPSGGGGDDSYNKDGSGKAIKMDAPIVKTWKNASNYTKNTYYVLLFFIFILFMGYRYLSHWNASIWLTCHAHECTLEVTPPGSRTKTVVFSRRQLLGAQAIKTDKYGKFLKLDNSKYEPPSRDSKGKYKSSYKGPDENGEYRSYQLKFAKVSELTPDENEQKDDEEFVPDGDFTPIMKFLSPDNEETDGNNNLVMHMKKFGFSQSRTRIRSTINKVESYARKRRQKLVIKESAMLPWQGILCLVFGFLGLMLTLLLGQFWDEPKKQQAGPGVRRQQTSTRKISSKEQPKFFVDTGRPSKYPPGYKKY